MPISDYVQSYKTHDWKVYHLSLADWAELRHLLDEGPDPHKCCHSETERAEQLKDDPDRFYIDWERAAADLDLEEGGEINTLKTSWRNHPAGSLVMLVYTKEFIAGQEATVAIAPHPVA